MGIQSIRCAVPYCASAVEEQTKCSLITRVAALGIGGIALLVGILALSGISALNTLGTVSSLVLTTLGSLTLLISLCLKCVKCNKDYCCHTTSDKRSIEHEVSHSSRVGARLKQLSDEEIIQNLQKQGYSRPIEEGGDGRCLFRVILPQITDIGIKKGLSSNYAEYFEGWADLPASSLGDDKLDRLRKMALAEEEVFLNSIQFDKTKRDTEQLSFYQKERIFELYKDMLQELENLTHEDICKRIENLGPDFAYPKSGIYEEFLYCQKNFEKYKNQTLLKYNWAGTSELIAIGQILERQIKAFGRDLYPSSLDKEGNVLPYYSSLSVNASVPIVVFQCNGGGHYRRLIPPTKNK